MAHAKRASATRAPATRASATRAPRSLRAAKGQLPPGRNGLGREQVAKIQRARMLSAMLEIVLELGAGNVTVADVVQRSGVSRRTFYENFSDREECFLAALDDALERIAAVLVPAYEGEDRTQRAHSWRERIRAALTELLGFLDEDPGAGRLVIVESLAAGPRALERRNRVLARLIAAVDEGRLGAGASNPPALTAEGVVGGVASILYARLSALPAPPVIGGPGSGEEDRGKEDRGSFVGLTNPLTAMIVLPYLGKAAAAKELERPVPPPRTLTARNGSPYPFRDIGMRLTYRTLRVLDAIATNPDASNRLLGEASGIADQGQMSKLLRRLQRLRLIDNVIGAPGKGGPNAWRLTEKGHTVHRAIEAPRGGAGS
jgi:AcrR family transcriptional regulator